MASFNHGDTMYGPHRDLPSRVWLAPLMKRTFKDRGLPPSTMAKKKKGGLGRLFGAITGGPFERLQKQIDKIIAENESEKKLARSLEQLVRVIGQQYEEGNIDEEEHDILVEEIEDNDPNDRSWAKVSDEEDMFYGDDMPDSPVLKSGKKVNLDELMAAKGDSFTGSFGRDEFDDFKAKMADEFFSDEVEEINHGRDDDRQLRMQNRAFGDEDADLKKMKQAIAAETGLDDPNAEEEEDEDHYFDEDGIEWWKDEEGWWWYRESDEHDWVQYEE